MSGNNEEEEVIFEIAIVLPKLGANKRKEKGSDGADCVEVLVAELRKKGLIVEGVVGHENEFIKLAAPFEVLGKAAADLQIRKKTHIGMDFPFELDEAEAFVRLPDGSLFSWGERFLCYKYLIDGIVCNEKSIVLKHENNEIHWNQGESLIWKLTAIGVVKEVFPLHEERMRKHLLRNWAKKWSDITQQPIDDVCSYYGIKVGTYFAFLGMYTRWMLFPAVLGLTVHFADFGSFQWLVLPFFFVCVISWAVLFFQFWKRKNAALSARLQIYHSVGAKYGYESFQAAQRIQQSPTELSKKQEKDRMKEKAKFQKEEWFGWLLRLRNDTLIILAIICLQLPFELAYAHLYEVLRSDILKFLLTAVYLITIQYFTKVGGKIAANLIKYEDNTNVEYRANSLVYKVFGLYFMQTYIGIFYHVLLHRNIKTLRQVLIQRLVIYVVMENLIRNSIPYLSYSFKKFETVRNKKKGEKGSPRAKPNPICRVEKDYLKQTYTASIGQGIEDGLFDDFLELVLQFGMITMFACAFPLAFAFTVVNNLTEIRTDSLKLLAMMRRPIPRSDATIGAWLNIFQFLIVMSICTNSALLVCLYDHEGQWSLSPGLAAILIMEHILLFIKFGFPRLVPEEPAWVKAARVSEAIEAEMMCRKQLLKRISSKDNYSGEMMKTDRKQILRTISGKYETSKED